MSDTATKPMVCKERTADNRIFCVIQLVTRLLSQVKVDDACHAGHA